MTKEEIKRIINDYDRLCNVLYWIINKGRPDLRGEFSIRPFIYDHVDELGVCIRAYPTDKNVREKMKSELPPTLCTETFDRYAVVPWKELMEN